MEAATSTVAWPLLLLSLVASLLFLLRRSHGRINSLITRNSSSRARRLPPGPPALLFLAKFLALRRSIFDLTPLLRDLHAHHGPVISLRLLFGGTLVNFLVAEIGRDEAVWTAAREFRPERFLDGGEGCDVDITGSKEIKMMPFGAGRRMCPGYALGMRHAEYLVARMVRELEWLPAAEGEVVDMAETVDFTTVMKHPLRARIVPRN
ncbi:cytochrome P450 89A2-like [Panicum miliaceum]|uniref:Cytochrome P450 89A2-like n=1 Tax=Panicum miliaceum TaxID=4540 RepID=A0A3L6QIQ9_PANMI|nr:cytochrome P450 89A2-like [Panicum miliaceum]